MDHAAVIALLGGVGEVAAGLRCNASQPSRWQTQGIPAWRFPAVVRLAKRLGHRQVTLDSLFAGLEALPARPKRDRTKRKACPCQAAA